MRIVAGVDFGTLSTRVTLLDSERGRLGTASAGYPLHRKREDPDFATQSHDNFAQLATTYLPNPAGAVVYEQLYTLYRQVYFAFGDETAVVAGLAQILRKLREIAAESRLQ